MTEWREATIAELCARTTSGGTPSRKRPDFFCEPPAGIPWVRSQELIDRRIDRCGEHITEEGLKGSSAKLVPRDSVLIAMYGATVGQLGYLDIEAATNQAICVLVTDPDATDPRFLYYSLMHGRSRLIEAAHGAAQQNLSQASIRAFSLRVPEVCVQRRIAGILTSIDDLIENNRRRVEVLEEMARAIYREWFVHFRYPGHEDVPLVDSPLGPIPVGWEVQPFSELASFVNGFAFKPSHWGDSGRPIIKIKQLKQGLTPDTPRCDPDTIAAKYWIEPGDLLFSWSADLGVYRWSDEPGLLNQHLFVVTPDERSSVAFLHHALEGAMSKFWDRAQGTTMRHIKRSALSEVTTGLPPHGLIRRFTEAVDPIDHEASALGHETRNLAGLRDLLLPRLVTGQIDVSGVDLDALAEVATA